MPDYIICYDEIKIGDISTSKKLENIPLVVLYSKCYNHQTNNSRSYIESKVVNTGYNTIVGDSYDSPYQPSSGRNFK